MAWGGARPGAGRKKVSGKPAGKAIAAKPERPALRAEPKVARASVAAEPKAISAIDPRAWVTMLPEIEELSRRYATKAVRTAERNPFVLPKFPAKAEPKDEKLTMAFDTNLVGNLTDCANGWLAGDVLAGLAGEGLQFMGYAWLSELAQQPEYRIMSETIADDATRKWIDFDVTGDEKKQREDRAKDPAGHDERMADPDERKKRVEAAGKTDRVKELQDDQLRLQVQQRYYEQARNGGFFGRTHLFHDIRTVDSNDIKPDELKTSIGDSRDAESKGKVPKGSFKGLRTIEPVWTYPLMYNAINPIREDWYNPQVWFVMGQEIHGSRLQTFVPHPVPDMLKPAYAFGGLSLTQMAKPYVDRWLTTVTSVNQLIHSFSVMVLMTDLSTLMQPGNVANLIARAAMFNMFRDNQGIFLTNKNTEDFKNVSATLSGLHELQAQSQEHVASINRIPLVKYTGIQPAGLNASSEGEIEVYDDTIGAYQMRVLDANLRRTINFEQLSLWGDVDPEITHSWQQLRPMTQEEKGKKEKDDAERNQKYVDMGAIGPGEVRRIIVNDKELPYTGLDPDDVPEPPADPDDDGGDGGGDRDSATGGGDRPDKGAGAPDPSKGGGANDADLPFGATDNRWALDPKTLKKVGGKMGSNEGGTFEGPGGERYYVKRPQSKAHVENELAAARLYQLAGVNTLSYRPVEGGNHVATDLEKLDKKNVADLTPAEREEATKDFAVHAWLSNHDAAGTGGDNQGVLNGKVTTLDVGGSLRYRAQGAPKGKGFGPKVLEVDSMRDPKVSHDAAKLFGKMTGDDIAASAQRVVSIPDAAIRRAVGADADLADVLIARKKDLATRFGLQAADEAPFEEGKHPRAPDGKFTSGGGGSTSPSPPPAGKPSAFGGLYKHAGAGDATQDYYATVDFYLNQPAKSGTHYRNLLKNLIENADHFAMPVQAYAKLKEHLGQAWANAGKQLLEKTFGTPAFTQATFDADKAFAKAKALGWKEPEGGLGAMAGQKAPPLVKAPTAPQKVEIKEPPKQKHGVATAAELAKAEKSVALQLQYVPGAPQTPQAQALVDKFNEKWAGKQGLSPQQLKQKVDDFKDIAESMKPLMSTVQKAQHEATQKQKASAAAAAKAQAAKIAAEMNDPAVKEHYEVLKGIGVGAQQLWKSAEATIKQHGLKITPQQGAYIRAYVGSHYGPVNNQLRKGIVTLEQWKYAAQLDDALDKMPKYEGTVHRGASLEPHQFERYKAAVGKVLPEPGFQSAGVKGKLWGSYNFQIKSKTARDIRSFNPSEGGGEVVFKNNTPFFVSKVEGNTVYMEEV